ncbi:MAG: AAA family ATPase [Bdellovibrionaceae bacterium]|nr:AAA family ATPase [Pseudobdellovibrionaceae bacterium]
MSSEKMSSENLERLTGIVERVTFHNEQNGWSVLKVSSFRDPGQMVTVLIHQAKVYAGATMEFWGTWGHHPKHGEQFKATRVVEKKPATAAALEKYLGSGLIKGVGPGIAKRIVAHFQEQTLEVFENRMQELLRVPGIAEKKLELIQTSWQEHRAIRDVMIFLQGYGISTLFATKIYKTYGDKAIAVVSENPYRLAHDIYGIGFFSADKVALSMGFDPIGEPRIEAGIKHVLAASRDEGHCYLTEIQIFESILELLKENIETSRISAVLLKLLASDQIKSRKLGADLCYYSKSLYFDELTTATRVKGLLAGQRSQIQSEQARILTWVGKYCQQEGIQLSEEQHRAVCQIPTEAFSILTGGPGCGKTTCTRVLAQLLKAMKKRVLLAAPTGRAAQRMSEVIGFEAKTIHRLLEWAPGKNGFNRDEKNPLQVDFLIIDESSMLDISLTASLLKAVPPGAQVLFIGDPDQLPAVGAGDVLADLLKSENVPRFRLTQVFRQAQASSIIRFAHEINSGVVPRIISPLARPQAFAEGNDCLFLDADEATVDQIRFLQRARWVIDQTLSEPAHEGTLLKLGEEWVGRLQKTSEGVQVDELFRPKDISEESIRGPVLTIPEKFRHVDLEKLAHAKTGIEELASVLKSVHPWSSLHYGLTAVDTVVRLSTKTISEWLGPSVEIQVLTPQVRGTLGTLNLNEALQRARNPEAPGKRQIQLGARIFREGDRVIQTRNNYDLGVFNGDIGQILTVDNEDLSCEVKFSAGEVRIVSFKKEDLSELSLAYAITIHKSQGSEFQVVIIPVMGQHFNMLFRNLIYTGLTRAKKLAIFVGSRRALAMAIAKIDNRQRQTALTELLA